MSITTSDNTSAKTSDGSTTTLQSSGSSSTVLSTEKTTEFSSTTSQPTTISETTLLITTEETPKTSTEKITYVYRPPPDEKIYTKTKYKPTERITTKTSDTVALIIGIIAGALIAVILIILVILKFKPRNDGAFKVEDKSYQQGPNAALLGNAGTTNGHQTQYQINGALRNGDKSQMQKSKKRDSKDIKEWYV